MNDLQRFNVGSYGAMVEDEDGTWCRYEDAMERIKELEKQNAEVYKKALGADMEAEIKTLKAVLSGIASRKHCYNDINGCGAAQTAKQALKDE